MIRSLTALILCVVISLPWAAKVVITADFAINQDYIAENLCENQDKPQLHCEGKCVLMQKLQFTEDNHDEPKPLPETLQMEVSSFLVPSFSFNSTTWVNALNKPLPVFIPNRVEVLFTHDIFHPPQLLA